MIRPATPADCAAMVLLGESMHAESRYASMQWSRAKVGGLIDLLIASPDGLALVVERDGQLVGGFLGMAQEHFFSTDKVSTDLALFIEPNRRGGLAAAQLLRAYVDWARERGVRDENIQCGITTGVKVEETDRLVRHVGFAPAGNLYVFQGNSHVR